jgi:hypothetical protein
VGVGSMPTAPSGTVLEARPAALAVETRRLYFFDPQTREAVER